MVKTVKIRNNMFSFCFGIEKKRNQFATPEMFYRARRVIAEKTRAVSRGEGRGP